MTPSATRPPSVLPPWLPLALLAATGCSPLSEQVKDSSVGMNGGFEHARSGLPVNWYVYTPATLPTAEYQLLFDREDHREGEQSLEFRVAKCSSEGGSDSPGLFQEYPAEPGVTYTVGFWIKSEGCDWTVAAGGVGAKTGRCEPLVSSAERADSWRRIEREVTVPPEYRRLRFELSVTSPGNLWIDGVTIEPVAKEGVAGG